MLLQHLPCPMIIGLVAQDKLDLIVRIEMFEIAPQILFHFAGCRCLDVQHFHHPRVNAAHIERATCFQRHFIARIAQGA